jgi:hypothetical protein
MHLNNNIFGQAGGLGVITPALCIGVISAKSRSSTLLACPIN